MDHANAREFKCLVHLCTFQALVSAYHLGSGVVESESDVTCQGGDVGEPKTRSYRGFVVCPVSSGRMAWEMRDGDQRKCRRINGFDFRVSPSLYPVLTWVLMTGLPSSAPLSNPVNLSPIPKQTCSLPCSKQVVGQPSVTPTVTGSSCLHKAAQFKAKHPSLTMQKPVPVISSGSLGRDVQHPPGAGLTQPQLSAALQVFGTIPETWILKRNKPRSFRSLSCNVIPRPFLSRLSVCLEA